jgi:subtilisin family serine protease
MGRLDPALRFLVEEETQGDVPMEEFASESLLAVAAPEGREPLVSVLVEFTGDVAALADAGLELRTVTGGIATGATTVSGLEALADAPGVVRVEGSRVLVPELDLAGPASGLEVVHRGPPGLRGSGVIVGIVDSGIDITHPAFRREDGTTRILSLWDQRLVPRDGEWSPEPFGFGVEYDRGAIDAALRTDDPASVVRHRDLDGHGTHVAGIAAGDGSEGPAASVRLRYVGAAPEADLVVVANTRGATAGELGLGDSADTLDAISYVFEIASRYGQPAVVNLSQGDNLGPHDGTSLLERGIDNLLGGPGRSVVKSAGNEGDRNAHASGVLARGGSVALNVVVPPRRRAPVMLDLWYPRDDRIHLTVAGPDGAPSEAVGPGGSTHLGTAGGSGIFVDHTLDDPGNGDNRIFVVLHHGGRTDVESGTWTLTLRGTEVTNGRWDCWIQRGEPRPVFPTDQADPQGTISVPGTAREIITVGSWVTRGAGVGTISTFSSRGGTRDGRHAPTLAAPGQQLVSAVPGGAYELMSGTSMAAPMVAGAIALMLQRRRRLTQSRIRSALGSHAAVDDLTGPVPNLSWGAGRLDVAATVGSLDGRRPDRPAPTPTEPGTGPVPGTSQLQQLHRWWKWWRSAPIVITDAGVLARARDPGEELGRWWKWWRSAPAGPGGQAVPGGPGTGTLEPDGPGTLEPWPDEPRPHVPPETALGQLYERWWKWW